MRWVYESFRGWSAAFNHARCATSTRASISLKDVAVGTSRLWSIRTTRRAATPSSGTAVTPSRPDELGLLGATRAAEGRAPRVAGSVSRPEKSRSRVAMVVAVRIAHRPGRPGMLHGLVGR